MEPALSPSPDEILETGSVIDGRYRIGGPLGGGGMACVYRADHLGIGRQVAIKVIHANLSHSREAVARFQQEAITSGRLEHPNIVTVIDSGMLPDGRCFLVMEALEGETLYDRLERDGRLPWRAAVALVRGILFGLQHAHDRGVIHRDIKPDNIFVLRRDEEPLVKILDFGIAKLYATVPTEARITQGGLTVGTPTYMSPEQAVDGEIAPASDLYSTTVVLFEMLTGQPPFDRSDPVATMKAHISQAPPRLREAAPEIDVPDGLDDIVQQGLAKIATSRLSSASRYLRLLDDLRARENQSRGGRPSTNVMNAPPSAIAQTSLAPARPGVRRLIFAALAVVVGLIAAKIVARPGSGTRPADGVGRIPSTDAAVVVESTPSDAAPAEDATPEPKNQLSTKAAEPGPSEDAANARTDRRSGSSATSGKDRRHDREQAKAWTSKGKTALAAGRFDEAGSNFQRAIAADSTAHAALGGLAEVAYNRGDFPRAVLTAKQAIALDPNSTAYRMTLAKAYYKILRYADAIKQWQKIVALDPTNATARKNIEMAKARMGP